MVIQGWNFFYNLTCQTEGRDYQNTCSKLTLKILDFLPVLVQYSLVFASK